MVLCIYVTLAPKAGIIVPADQGVLVCTALWPPWGEGCDWYGLDTLNSKAAGRLGCLDLALVCALQRDGVC